MSEIPSKATSEVAQVTLPKIEEQIAEAFVYHEIEDAAQAAKYLTIREKAQVLAKAIVQNCPPCADRTAAIRKLRETVMTANAAIALKGLI